MTDVSLSPPRFAAGEFRVGRVLSRTLSVLGRNLLPFCLVTVIASLPNAIFFPTEQGEAAVRGVGWLFLGWILGMLLNALSQAIVLYGAFEDMRSRRVDIVESMRVGLRRFLPVLGVAILTTIVIAIGFMVLVIPGIIVFTMLFVAMPVCVVEGLGPWDSMHRSAELTKGQRWKIFGLLIVVGIVLALLGIILGMLLGFVLMGLLGVGDTLLGIILQLFWGALWGAFYAILVVVTYHDLRVAKEGVDTDQIAAVFD